VDEGTPRLVTDRQSPRLFLIENNMRRRVPDLWTLKETGVSSADLEILSADELEC
jgi:hypothetical protein